MPAHGLQWLRPCASCGSQRSAAADGTLRCCPGHPSSCLKGPASMKHVAFSGRLVILGCGSIGQGVLPLILRHIDLPRERIHIVTADTRGGDVAAEFGVTFTIAPVRRDNYRDLLGALLGQGDFLLNLSV